MSASREFAVCVPSSKVLAAIDIDLFDAFYLGQPYCLLREGNFIVDLDGLQMEATRLHTAGKKVYLTTPAIPKGKDLPKVSKALELAAAIHLDGVEVHDVGVFRLLRSDFGQLRPHIGNFLNVYNQKTAALWRDLGAARVVPNHELTGDELALVAQTEGLEFEHPVHGPLALGMSYSCVLRRELPEEGLKPCRQQCADEHYLALDGWRMRSVGTSLLTAEDYCLVEHLGQLLASNISALRLETYFDSPEKINRLGAIYRQALSDALDKKPVSGTLPDEAANLASSGLCNGWHFGKSGREYVSATEAEAAGDEEAGITSAV